MDTSSISLSGAKKEKKYLLTLEMNSICFDYRLFCFFPLQHSTFSLNIGPLIERYASNFAKILRLFLILLYIFIYHITEYNLFVLVKDFDIKQFFLVQFPLIDDILNIDFQITFTYSCNFNTKIPSDNF